MALAQQPEAQNAGRGVVRQRSEDELEPCVFPLEDGSLSQEHRVRLRSTASTDESVITFVNDSPNLVRAIWINFQGHEVEYTVIEARAKRRYRTYVSHPWIMRDANTGARMMLDSRMVVISSKRDQEVHITSAPALPWTLDNHKHFPETFKAVTKAVLIGHHRVRHTGPTHKDVASFSLKWPLDTEPSSLPMPVKATEGSRMTFSITASPARGYAPLATSFPPQDLSPATFWLDTSYPSAMPQPLGKRPLASASVPPARCITPESTSTLHPFTSRAARMFGWVVDKVVKRSSHQSVQQASQDSGQDRRGRLEADGLSHMAALPQHMVIAILEHLAPTDVYQCVTRGPSSARPDILPALLVSDPATWPPITPPAELPM